MNISNGDKPSSHPYGDSTLPAMQELVPRGLKNILDVGCHAGGFGLCLKQRDEVCVWGVEPDPSTAAHAQKRLDKVIVGFFPNAEVPENYFDAIIFNDVLEHIADPSIALEAAKLCLREGGLLIASIPNIRHIDNLLHILREKDFKYEVNGIRDRTHLRFFTKISIERLFKENGFELISIKGINETWWSPSILRRLAFRIFPDYLADTKFIQYAVVAKPIRVSAAS